MRNLALAALILASSVAAHADTYHFVYTTNPSFSYLSSGSFDLPSQPTPFSVGGGDEFHLFGVNATVNQDTYTNFHANFGEVFGVRFFNVTQYGELTPFGGSISGPSLFDFYSPSSPAFFTGENATPIFQLGTFDGYYGTLVISDLTPPVAAATPEPSSFALLGTGILGAAGVLRKRFV